jgi:hypothetical protein
VLKNIEIKSFYSLDLFLLLLKTWKMTTDWLLNEVAMITETNLDWMKKRYRLYSENQLNWKPNKDTWSLNEIFAHLNEYANFYHSVIFKRLETTKYRTPSATFSSSPLGKSAWGSMKLGNAKNIKRKFNAPKLYNPSINKQLVSGNDCQTFEEKQREFLSLMCGMARLRESCLRIVFLPAITILFPIYGASCQVVNPKIFLKVFVRHLSTRTFL